MDRWKQGCLAGCGIALFALLLVAILGVQRLAKMVNTPKPPDPVIGASVALRPTFILRKGGHYQAGTAVAVRLHPGSAPILITALHLFGPAGGLEKNTPPGELDQLLAGIQLSRFGGKLPQAMAVGSLRKVGLALDENSDDVSPDVAAFSLLPDSKVNALDLAPDNPRTFEWVWLVGDEYEHQPQQQRLWPAKVLRVSDGGTRLRFRDKIVLQGFSGAPVINAKKQVVGILIGGDENQHGIMNTARSIRARLSESGVM